VRLPRCGSAGSCRLRPIDHGWSLRAAPNRPGCGAAGLWGSLAGCGRLVIGHSAPELADKYYVRQKLRDALHVCHRGGTWKAELRRRNLVRALPVLGRQRNVVRGRSATRSNRDAGGIRNVRNVLLSQRGNAAGRTARPSPAPIREVSRSAFPAASITNQPQVILRRSGRNCRVACDSLARQSTTNCRPTFPRSTITICTARLSGADSGSPILRRHGILDCPVPQAGPVPSRGAWLAELSGAVRGLSGRHRGGLLGVAKRYVGFVDPCQRGARV